MARRSDNPMTILIMGILLMAGFGVALVLLTETTPVLKLRPLLNEKFDAEFRTRFRPSVPGRPAALEVILPSAQASPPETDLALAEFALESYIDLALETEVGSTSVEQVEIRIEGEPSPRYVLTRLQINAKAEAERELSTLQSLVGRHGFQEVEVEVAGYSRTGAKLKVTCVPGPDLRDPERSARRVITVLSSRAFLGSVEVQVGGPRPLTLIGGRDTPLPPPARPRRRRQRRPLRRPAPTPAPSGAPTAPVESQSRGE